MAFSASPLAHVGFYGGAGGNTSSAINTTGANLIVIHVGHYNAIATPSDSKSNTWTSLTAVGNSPVRSNLFYCLNPTVGSGHTFTINSIFASVEVSAWSGAKTSSVFDQENGAADTDEVFSPGSVTPSENNELVIVGGCVYAADGVTLSVDGGFTVSDSKAVVVGDSVASLMGYIVQTTATASNPTFTASASSLYTASTIATFKAEPGGGSVIAVRNYYAMFGRPHQA
jgi:hypothetical protein